MLMLTMALYPTLRTRHVTQRALHPRLLSQTAPEVALGLADISRHFIECYLTQETRVQSALDDRA